jgi:hypothetical protein
MIPDTDIWRCAQLLLLHSDSNQEAFHFDQA